MASYFFGTSYCNPPLTIKKSKYDLQAGDNIIMMPREIGKLRKNRVTHNGPHPKYNKYVGEVLDSMVYMENPESEFRKFVNFLKIGCRFRPQDIPWITLRFIFHTPL